VTLSQRLAAEGLGTALLLAVVIGSGIMGERLAGGNVAIALLANTLATVGGLYVLIEVFGPISGAHFNPAVSLVMAFRGALPKATLAPYIVAQLLGAMLGAWLAHAMFDLSLLQWSSKLRSGTGQWIAEAVATFGLLLVILRLLVYRLDLVRQPSGGLRSHVQRQFCRHRSWQRTGLRAGATRRRRAGAGGGPGAEG
jgi:glycerol uptake facilitator-like aquaporin